jgi:hypothetical protein
MLAKQDGEINSRLLIRSVDYLESWKKWVVADRRGMSFIVIMKVKEIFIRLNG